MTYYVYILASARNGTLYIGVTNDLIRRVHDLVYFEETENVESAIRREKRMKKWPRQWKINQIEQANPDWRDLYPELTS